MKILTFLLLYPCWISAQIHYVNLNTQGSETGVSWENAFTNLNSALHAAQHGDSIWIAQGDYIMPDTQLYYSMKSGVKLFGGFKGDETHIDQRDWTRYRTELRAGNKVFLCMGTDSTTLIDGLTLYAGYAVYDINNQSCGDPRDWYIACRGGAINILTTDSNMTSCLRIRNCVFSNNVAQAAGGAIDVNAELGKGGLWIENTEFFRNNALNIEANCTTAGVYIRAGTQQQLGYSFNNCVFLSNYSFGTIGTVYYICRDSTTELSFENCIFRNNGSGRGPGNVSTSTSINTKQKTYFINCLFESNYSGVGYGGAVVTNNSIFRNCIFKGNSAWYGGAVSGVNLEFYNTVFVNNSARIYGGAVMQRAFGPRRNQCHYVHVTFANNNSAQGGAIHCGGRITSNFSNCIVWNNHADEGEFILSNAMSYINFSHCLSDLYDSSYLWLHTNFHPDSIHIGPGNIWNSTYPMFADTAAGDLRIGACSPAVNMADSAATQQYGITHDLAGNPRSFGGRPDMGAFEALAFDPIFNHTDESCHNYLDGTISVNPGTVITPISLLVDDTSVQDTLVTGLSQGDYIVILEDLAGCSDTTLITISGPGPVNISDTLVHCSAPDQADGRIELRSIEGEYPPFELLWSTGQSTQHIDQLLPGTYSLTVTDAQFCQHTRYYELSFVNSINDYPSPESGRLHVRPNPANSFIELYVNESVKTSTVSLSNSLGVTLYSTKLGPTDRQAIINTTDIPPGIYFCTLHMDGKLLETRKVVIAR